MHPRIRHHPRSVRIQAALVAFVYVVFCTLGSLTHTHFAASSEGAGRAAASARPPSARLVLGVGGYSTATPAIRQASAAAPSDCAFCEWQANCVSPALAVHRVVPPIRTRAVSVSRPTPVYTTFLLHFSSRAPPAA